VSPTGISLDQIDLDISLAFIALGVARSTHLRCPSPENAVAVANAEIVVDGLLDARLIARA
jgi:hypothetical protein